MPPCRPRIPRSKEASMFRNLYWTLALLSLLPACKDKEDEGVLPAGTGTGTTTVTSGDQPGDGDGGSTGGGTDGMIDIDSGNGGGAAGPGAFQLLGPTGKVSDATPDVSWTVSQGAVKYEV